MNYWYSSTDTEIFCDIDRIDASMKHLKSRLQGMIECKKIQVKKISIFSTSKNHCHVIIVLQFPLPPIDRAVFAMILHSDIYRAACTVMRICYNVSAPDVLISKDTVYHRTPDDSCDCISKHNAATMQTCPAAIRLRGENRNIGFFGRPSKDAERTLAKIWPMPEMEKVK